MRFNCGPTKKEREQARHDRMVKYAKSIFNNGEVVFALLPKRLTNGQCAWLEKVRRWPSHYYQDYYEDWGLLCSEDKAVSCYLSGTRMKYRYEALDKRT